MWNHPQERNHVEGRAKDSAGLALSCIRRATPALNRCEGAFVVVAVTITLLPLTPAGLFTQLEGHFNCCSFPQQRHPLKA